MSDASSTVEDGDLVYRMDRKRRGMFIIFNNQTFLPETNMPDRPGSDIDAASLAASFQKLGFKCKLHTNKTKQEMINIMIKVGKHDHSDADCFGCAVLTHGDETHLFGTDQILTAQDLFASLKGDKCPSLVLKPKLFFIQACRGSEFDDGVDAFDTVDGEVMSSVMKFHVPIESDCLYAYSTVEGFFSWRNSVTGSCFVQALCKVLNEWGSQREIMAILTRVNHIVAYQFESRTSRKDRNEKKQIPSIVTQLTKRLYFPLKN